MNEPFIYSVYTTIYDFQLIIRANVRIHSDNDNKETWRRRNIAKTKRDNEWINESQ